MEPVQEKISSSGLHANIKRLSHLDILRLLAIYLVVFNHTGDRGYMLFADKMGSPLYFVYMAASVFCKIAVPIFFMISGALLLPKEESLKKLFSKRVFRMAVMLILASVPYYYLFNREHGIGIFDFFTYIYGNNATTSLWYLYSYIGLLLLLPFLRSMVKGMKQNDFIYLLAGHIVLVGIIPCLEYCFWSGNTTLNDSFSSVLFITQNVFFALMGYYIEHVMDEKHYNKKTVAWSVILCAVSIAITCLVTYYQAINAGVSSTDQQEAFFNSFICIPAITVYFLIKYISYKKGFPKHQKIISILGASVFGVYLIEKIIRLLTRPVYTVLAPFLGSFVASLVWCLATCCLAFLIIVSLKHIPIIKKVVNKFI